MMYACRIKCYSGRAKSVGENLLLNSNVPPGYKVHGVLSPNKYILPVRNRNLFFCGCPEAEIVLILINTYSVHIVIGYLLAKLDCILYLFDIALPD